MNTTRLDHVHAAALRAVGPTISVVRPAVANRSPCDPGARRPGTRAAGVGTQTIYRWWPSKGAVALESLDDSLATVVDFQDTGDIVEDLRHHMQGVTQLINSTQLGPVIQGLIAAAQSDPALSRAHLERVIEPANVAWLDRIGRAQASGEIRADADPQQIIDMLFGAMYFRLMLHTRPSESKQIDAALDIALNGLR